MLEHPGIFPPSHTLHDQYHALLAERGFLTKGGLVRSIDFINAFVEYYTPSLLYQLNCEMNQNSAHSAWLARLVTATNGQQSPPLHHMLAIHFLGSRVENFLCQKIKPSLPFGEGPWPCLNPTCEHYQQKCINVCNLERKWRGGNIIVGSFKCECGFTYVRVGPDRLPEDVFRKDKVISYGEVWNEKLRELWLDSTITRREIARRLGMSEGNVTNRAIKLGLDVPRTSPYKSKGRPRKIRNIQWYRTQWLVHVETASEKGITSLREGAPALYQWLYDNDREWFSTHRPPSRPWRKEGRARKNLTFQNLKAKLQPQDEVSRDIRTA
jgi:hypothetical protein